MIESNLVVICVSAFLAVFAILGLLALVMGGLLRIFPYLPPAPAGAEAGGIDPALLAAVTAAAAFAFPGTRVSHVEEQP